MFGLALQGVSTVGLVTELLPTDNVRSRGSCVSQRRGSPTTYMTRESLWLALTPSVLSRTLGTSGHVSTRSFLERVPPLAYVHATPAFSTQLSHSCIRTICRRSALIQKYLACARWPYSISGLKYPSLHSSHEKRPRFVALNPGSPTPRVWLPSLWRQQLQSLGTFLSSQHSWALPFKAFLFPHGR